MGQVMRPRTFDDVFRSGTLDGDLVRQAAAFSHDEKIKRIAEIIVIHDRVVGGVRAFEPHLPTGLYPEQDRRHRKGVPVVSRYFAIRFRTVALGIPELDVRLLGGESNGIAAFSARGFLPQFGVGESIVQSGESEGAERKLGEEARMILLILCQGIVHGAVMPN